MTIDFTHDHLVIITVGQQFLATVGHIVGCLGSTAIACTVFDVQIKWSIFLINS